MINWIKEHVMLTILIVIGFIGATIGGIEFSSSTFFCSNACHIMKLEADNFAKSYHKKIGDAIGGHGIGCKSCHYGPGIMGIVSAKVGAMLHEAPNTILGREGIDWDVFVEEMKEQGYGEDQSKWPQQYIHQTGKRKHGIKPHGKKFEDTNYNCRRCHTPIAKYIVQNGLLGEDIKVEKAGLVDEHLESQLPPKNWDDRLLRKVGKINKDHPGHQDRGLYCTDCHMEIVHGSSSDGYNMPTMERCFRCHNNQRAFRDDCARCHTTQKNMHKGVNGIGVEVTPSYMNDQAGCADCHPESNQYKQDRQACVGCHDAEHAKLVDDWQNNIRGLLSNIKPNFTEVSKLISEAHEKGRNTEKAQRLFNEAKYNYDYVVADGSNGGHNVDFAESLLDVANKKLEAAKEALK
ncbi:ammonia-forming cytochrome c nitrite reductase subunit c552 [Candidatus Poribacteria bacterium]|nr:ammonia-forming cytochrome c nitrite reductase subunit c552 [Candidatus Poribacteria bacterium]